MTLLLPLTLLRRAPTTPPPTHAAAARTALAPHQRRIRDHEPVRPSTARAGPTLPPAACTGQLAPLRACLAATHSALAPHQRRTRDLGPDRHGTACMCSRALTPLRARLAATRTALAPHQRPRIRSSGPARCHALLIPLTLSMHRVLTLTRIRLTSLPARPCRASHDPGRPSWPYHDLILTRP